MSQVNKIGNLYETRRKNDYTLYLYFLIQIVIYSLQAVMTLANDNKENLLVLAIKKPINRIKKKIKVF